MYRTLNPGRFKRQRRFNPYCAHQIQKRRIKSSLFLCKLLLVFYILLLYNLFKVELEKAAFMDTVAEEEIYITKELYILDVHVFDEIKRQKFLQEQYLQRIQPIITEKMRLHAMFSGMILKEDVIVEYQYPKVVQDLISAYDDLTKQIFRVIFSENIAMKGQYESNSDSYRKYF